MKYVVTIYVQVGQKDSLVEKYDLHVDFASHEAQISFSDMSKLFGIKLFSILLHGLSPSWPNEKPKHHLGDHNCIEQPTYS